MTQQLPVQQLFHNHSPSANSTCDTTRLMQIRYHNVSRSSSVHSTPVIVVVVLLLLLLVGSDCGNGYCVDAWLPVSKLTVLPTIPSSTTLLLLHSQQYNKNNHHHHHRIIAHDHHHHPTTASTSSSTSSRMSVSTLRQRPTTKHYSKSSISNNNNKDDNTNDSTAAVAVARPDPSILLSSQSDTIQQLGILGISTALGGGTYIVIQLLSGLEAILPVGWYSVWRDTTWPIPFGLIFIAAGVAHFTMKETFVAMVPPKNTWGGLWQVPAPLAESFQLSYELYHVYWSGMAEIGGGVLLILSFLFHIVPITIPAFLIFLLLICVTPANIYMATHDVQAPGLPPIPYPVGHVGRGILQCILLAMFWKLTFQ
jgi:uncharacterized membrane protein